MTVKEFWGLKLGTIVGDVDPNSGWGFIGRVIKREIQDEIYGFVMNRFGSVDLTTGRKILVITLDTGNGFRRYLESNRDLSDIKIYPEGTKLKS